MKTASTVALWLVLTIFGTMFVSSLLPSNANAGEGFYTPSHIVEDNFQFELYNISGLTQICVFNPNLSGSNGEPVGSCSNFHLVLADDPITALRAGMVPAGSLHLVDLLIFLNFDLDDNLIVCATLPRTPEGVIKGNCVPFQTIHEMKPKVAPLWSLEPGEGSPDNKEFSI